MNLPTRKFTDIVRDMSAAITASAGRLLDISVGSILRAIIDANASIVLWAQWAVLLTLQTTRAATSAGSDLDSWTADFSLSRLPAMTASGIATFSRYSATTAAFIPTGTIVKTQDGAVAFSISADPTNSAWQPTLNSYSLAASVVSIDLPIAASVAGTAGNVLSGTITLLASAVPGIDYVNNLSATNGGADAETDAALRVRFTSYFAARSRATIDAISYAISLVGPDLKYLIQENVDAAGNFSPGNMLIVVDDGSGAVTDALLNALSLAIGAVRPIGTNFAIQPPQVMEVSVSLSLICPPELSLTTVQTQLQAAIEAYVTDRPLGSTLSITRISQLAYRTVPQIINISNVMLNGQSVDLIAPFTTMFLPQSVSFV